MQCLEIYFDLHCKPWPHNLRAPVYISISVKFGFTSTIRIAQNLYVHCLCVWTLRPIRLEVYFCSWWLIIHVIFIIQFLCSKKLTGIHAQNSEFTFQVDLCIPHPHSTHSFDFHSIHIWCIWMQNAQLLFASKCIRNEKNLCQRQVDSVHCSSVSLEKSDDFLATSLCHLWIVSTNGMQFEREEWKSGLNRLTDRDNNCFRQHVCS